jgi:hypothetical protein
MGQFSEDKSIDKWEHLSTMSACSFMSAHPNISSEWNEILSHFAAFD